MKDMYGTDIQAGDFIAFSAKDLGGHCLKVAQVIRVEPPTPPTPPKRYTPGSNGTVVAVCAHAQRTSRLIYPSTILVIPESALPGPTLAAIQTARQNLGL